MQYEKFIIPVSIILGCLIIGGSVLGMQIFKQSSIERQKILELEYEKEIKEKELAISESEFELTKEQKNKEYISNRKQECLKIYETESKKFNNVNSYTYNTEKDSCYLEYKNGDWKEGDPISTKYFSKSFDDNDVPVNYVSSNASSNNLEISNIEGTKFLFHFYDLIGKGKLNEAYQLSSKKVNYDTFNNWYKNIENISVEKVNYDPKNKYIFEVIVFITENGIAKKYTVLKTLKIDSNGLISIFDTKTISVK